MRTRNLASVLLALTSLLGLEAMACAQQRITQAKLARRDDAEEARRFTVRDRLRYYERKTFRPSSVLSPALGAAVTEWTTGVPSQWGQGLPGFGRRLISGYARQMISNTVGLGIGLADHEDPRHYATRQHGIWKRGLCAAREAVIARRAGTVDLMPAFSRIIGDYTAGFVSNAWYPAQARDVDNALWRGTTALASDVAWQEFKEFWPDVRRKLRLHHRTESR